MKRFRVPLLMDIVISEDAAEIESLAQDPNLDRAYADRSLTLNRQILDHIQQPLQIDGKPFPTVATKDAPGRAAAQDALWTRLSALAPAVAAGPDDLESLAAFVRGEGPSDACGPLVQEAVGRLFTPNFTATAESWKAALVLDQAPRAVNPIQLVSWSLSDEVEHAKELLAGMVDGDLAAVHAIGIAVHNMVSGVMLMRQLYGSAADRSTLTAEAAGSKCIFAPATVVRQPTAATQCPEGELETETLVMLNLQAAHAQSPDPDLAFLRNSWSRCPAEQWVPALLAGIWRRACGAPS